MAAEPPRDASGGATLLLPAARHWGSDLASAPRLAALLARADRTQANEGDEAQLARAFDLLPRGLPVAALTRDHDRGDAALHAWLRADPAHVRADLGSGRLLACGDMGLDPAEAEQLLQSLRPLFGDEGAPISSGAPSRWYLALPRDTKLPEFVPPSRVLGDDIFAHLPQGDTGRRWRRLLSEAQVILHNHPLNAARIASGKLPVNTLWFWGGGVLPDHVRAGWTRVCSDDLLIAALAQKAGCAHVPLPGSAAVPVAGALFDLRRLRDPGALERDWIMPLLQASRRGALGRIDLDLGDGTQLRWWPRHRWRWWRRPLRTLT